MKCVIVKYPNTGEPRGFAFIQYKERSACESALAEYNEKELCGQKISVVLAKPPDQETTRKKGGSWSRHSSSYSTNPPSTTTTPPSASSSSASSSTANTGSSSWSAQPTSSGSNITTWEAPPTRSTSTHPPKQTTTTVSSNKTTTWVASPQQASNWNNQYPQPQTRQTGNRRKRAKTGSGPNNDHHNAHHSWKQNPANMSHWNNPSVPNWSGSWGANPSGSWNNNAWPPAGNVNPQWTGYNNSSMMGANSWGSNTATSSSNQSNWSHFANSNPMSYFGNANTPQQHIPQYTATSYTSPAAYGNYPFNYGQPNIGSGQSNIKPFIG
jgi:hypothetical protein